MISLFRVASGKSVWRGIDYFEKGKVKTCKKESETIYSGSVEGSSNQIYQVKIDLDHAKRSVCTCPFAKDRRVVCKHMIALSCVAIPGLYEDWMKEVAEYEEEEQREQEQHLIDLKKYIYSLNKAKLREELYSALLELENIYNNRW